MKSRVLFLTLAVVTSSFAAERWWSPDKAYSIIPPPDWSQNVSKGEQGSSYAFKSPDRKAEIRISAAYHISLPETMPDDVLEMAFPKERATTPITHVRGDGWDGLHREYTDTNESSRWLGVAARHKSTVVLLTMKAPAKEFEHFRPAFDSVAQSLRLAQ
jgi:hypothetical protein